MSFMRRNVSLLALALVIAAGAHAGAQRPADVVRWSAKAADVVVKAGATVPVEITADVQEGWHLYALSQPKSGPIPLAFAVAKGKPFEIRTRALVAPKAAVVQEPNFNLETHQYDAKGACRIPLSAARAATPGPHSVPVEITCQACGNGICLRPFTQTLPIDVTVTASTAAR